MTRFVFGSGIALANNWNLIKTTAQKHPNDYIHAIYMDFDKALNNVELTVKQNNVLINVMSGIPLIDGERGHLDKIIEKIYKIM